MFEKIIENVTEKTPLVHCITNYVTVNDVANMVLACGGSPIMADDAAEVEEITSICSALVINIGTLNERTIESMLRAGLRANEMGHPVILDPVGAGASTLRTQTALRLLGELDIAVVRGNSSEIRALATGMGGTSGVDANAADAVTEENLPQMIAFAKQFAQQMNTVVAITGAIDLVTDGKVCYTIRNGCAQMSKITGTGCMLTGVLGAYCGANPDTPLEAAAAAVCAMGMCGELAAARSAGTGSMRMVLMDVMSTLDVKTLEGGMKLEIR